jgi:hypothetical protein
VRARNLKHYRCALNLHPLHAKHVDATEVEGGGSCDAQREPRCERSVLSGLCSGCASSTDRAAAVGWWDDSDDFKNRVASRHSAMLEQFQQEADVRRSAAAAAAAASPLELMEQAAAADDTPQTRDANNASAASPPSEKRRVIREAIQAVRASNRYSAAAAEPVLWSRGAKNPCQFSQAVVYEAAGKGGMLAFLAGAPYQRQPSTATVARKPEGSLSSGKALQDMKQFCVVRARVGRVVSRSRQIQHMHRAWALEVSRIALTIPLKSERRLRTPCAGMWTYTCSVRWKHRRLPRSATR